MGGCKRFRRDGLLVARVDTEPIIRDAVEADDDLVCIETVVAVAGDPLLRMLYEWLPRLVCSIVLVAAAVVVVVDVDVFGKVVDAAFVVVAAVALVVVAVEVDGGFCCRLAMVLAISFRMRALLSTADVSCRDGLVVVVV